MGDMADYLLDTGLMFDDDRGESGREREGGPAGIGCRYCLAGPLYWGETAKGWRLFESRGKLHECKEYRGGRR